MFDDEDYDEMEMPTPCMKCGKIFELTDGTAFKNTIYCDSCGTKLNQIEELKDRIKELKESMAYEEKCVSDSLGNIQDYKIEIKQVEAELKELEQ
jgi:DNA-directed RNA polymerase subunit RPC12/RpoP